MSVPQIPNLNTRRRGGGRRGGRGRGIAPGGTESSRDANSFARDMIIQGTDNDAATSRSSAVEAGYLDDPYAKLIVPSGTVDKRLPLMNRG